MISVVWYSRYVYSLLFIATALMIITLSVKCNGQSKTSLFLYIFNCVVLCSALTFATSATAEGDTITVNIRFDSDTITTATFQCQLDSGPFEDCKF